MRGDFREASGSRLGERFLGYTEVPQNETVNLKENLIVTVSVVGSSAKSQQQNHQSYRGRKSPDESCFVGHK